MSVSKTKVPRKGVLLLGSGYGALKVAEDVAQEAFLKLSRHLPSLGSRSHVLFWLRQVTCRLCIDELRRRRPGSLEDHAEPGVEPALGDPFLEARLRRRLSRIKRRGD